MKDIKKIVSKYIKDHQLLEADGKYLVALSGGADSVSLLLILKELGYPIEACHCNFHLRGEESDRDEQFCLSLCQRLEIPFHRIHFDTKSYATLHKVSIEMAARDLRYRYFEQLRHDLDATAICVAHHQDDSVETILINLIRGTGINGLTGIAPRNGYILRPLLCIERKDILDYLANQQQDYVTDSTNLVDDVVRNKIRLHIIPMLKEINPSVCNNIISTAQHLSDASEALSPLGKLAYEKEGMIFLDKQQVLSQASPAYALFANLSQYGFTGAVIQEILEGINTVGKTWCSSSHQLLIDRDSILITQKKESSFKAFKIPETGCYVYEHNDESEKKIKLRVYERTSNFEPSKEKMTITLDADKVSFPLLLRTAQTGDRFHPFGMKGSKLVSDYLTDRKKNLLEKQAQKVLTDSKGNIIWLIGERTSDDSKITEATTRILEINI